MAGWMDGGMEGVGGSPNWPPLARTHEGRQPASIEDVRPSRRTDLSRAAKAYVSRRGRQDVPGSLSLSLSLVSRGSIVGGARTHARTHAQECDHTILGSHMLINSWCTHALDEAAYTNTQGHVS
jgi:hypothetical protein